MATSLLHPCNFNLVRCSSASSSLSHSRSFLNDGQKISDLPAAKGNRLNDVVGRKKESKKLWVLAATENSRKSEENVPDWARPGSDEPPPWARDEATASSSQQSFEIPFFVYLLASAITAIAAIGSVFEYVNKKPVFGILSSDSVFYTPLLGFFVFTGVPTSAFLWFKSVQAANKEAEEQDRRDGFK